VIALWSQLPLDHVAGLVCPARPMKAASVADMGVILASTVDSTRFPPGVRAGIGAAANPDRSWHDARTALLFTTARQLVVHFNELGALALLAEVPHDAVRDNAEVIAIARLAGNPKSWILWTCTVPPARYAARRTFSTCTTAASSADSKTSEGPSPAHRTDRAQRTGARQARTHFMAAPHRLITTLQGARLA
jgi:hypothetical protein